MHEKHKEIIKKVMSHIKFDQYYNNIIDNILLKTIEIDINNRFKKYLYDNFYSTDMIKAEVSLNYNSISIDIDFYDVFNNIIN